MVRRTAAEALVIRGARRVGKSTLVRQFAQARGLPILEVNLEQHRRFEAVFASLDMNSILLELEAICRVSPGPGTLLFLDEIQATPSAIGALRYLYEQRTDQPVVAADSLLEMVLKNPQFSMPKGRIEYLHLGPFSFGDFLLGLRDSDLLDDLSACWSPRDPGPTVRTGGSLRSSREFLLIGGIPEAVAAFAAAEGIESVRCVHRSIVAIP